MEPKTPLLRMILAGLLCFVVLYALSSGPVFWFFRWIDPRPDHWLVKRVSAAYTPLIWAVYLTDTCDAFYAYLGWFDGDPDT